MECNESDWYDWTKICPDCKGEVHSHFGDEDSEGDYWLRYHCHKCGRTFEQYDWEDMENIR